MRIVGEEHAAVVGVEVEVGHAVLLRAYPLGRSHLSWIQGLYRGVRTRAMTFVMNEKDGKQVRAG